GLVRMRQGGVGLDMFVRFVELPAVDQDRAVRFYTEMLGFRVAEDAAYQDGWRWLLLEIPGAETKILLTKKDAGDNPNSSRPNLALTVDDVEGLYRELKEKGVEFPQELTSASWNPAETRSEERRVGRERR